MTEDSFQRRYLAKLTTNLVGILPALVNTFLAPRMLGPAGFGIYNFVEDFFFKTYGFLSPGVTVCFYTRLSQNPEALDLKRFFWRLSLVIIALAALGTGLALASGQGPRLWPDVAPRFVIFGLAVVTFLWLQEILGQVVDAHAFTVSGERAKLLVRVLFAALLAGMFFLGLDSLELFFWYRLLFGLAMVLGAIWVLRRNGAVTFPRGKIEESERRALGRDFWSYSSPLVVFGLLGGLIAIGDRWLLQHFSGAEEQGFFSLGLKVAVLVFLVVQPITTLYTRELSRAHAVGDDAEMKRLTKTLLPRFFSIAAWLSMAAALNPVSVSKVAGGGDFAGASAAVGLMALYPLGQTYGQLSGAFCFATDRTRLFRNIGLIMLLLGLPATVFLLGPAEWHGLSLGSVGIALKTVVFAIVGANLTLWYVCRHLSLNFFRFAGHQILCCAAFVLCAFLARTCAEQIVAEEDYFIGLMVNGCFYVPLSVLVICIFPPIIGFTRPELSVAIASAKQWISRR